ncbi:MAG: hypothetical protein KAW12_04535 [Candidatus Aminicenantes bacterium]|nr:hypothetical protein [Candidatus Aminicenantes bacterium]
MKPVKLGQNFLVNKNIAKKIALAFFPVDGCILEIGPGTGILTGFLVEYRTGENKIFAVELDKELYTQIKTKYREKITVINRSILDLNLEETCGPGDINLTGNLPYYISREIIDWVITQAENTGKGIFMMQKEFVDKLILSPAEPPQTISKKRMASAPYEGPGNRISNQSDRKNCSFSKLPGAITKKNNAQSLIFNYLFEARKLFDVSPGSFSPPPKVKSTVFLFEKKKYPASEKIDSASFYLFLKNCFKNRRKTLFNNLTAAYPPGQINEIFEKTGLDARLRTGQLTLPDFVEIFRLL